MIKFEPQLVAVARADPKDLTLSGNNSDCCQGTFPKPEAYAAVYNVNDMRMISGVTDVVVPRIERLLKLDGDSGRLIEENAIEHIKSDIIMMGIEDSRMRRRPIRSISEKARSVNKKLVRATDIDVNVGDENWRLAKIVAEKYMRLLKPQSC